LIASVRSADILVGFPQIRQPSKAGKNVGVPENVSCAPSQEIRMPSRAMVVFLVKWAIATIPAFLILALIASMLLGGVLSSLF
jgi:hypothetical protein